MKKAMPITRLQMREMAVAATVDDRTMQKYLRGEYISAISRERIKRGLEAKGMTHLLLLPGEARR